MKKKILSLVMVLLFVTSVRAVAEESVKQSIRFIYINGSNNNTEKDRRVFYNGMKKLHPRIKKAFESNSFTKENFLKNDTYSIANDPKVFFWGYDSGSSYVSMKTSLVSLDFVSPKIAQAVRTLIASVIHDAVWVQKEKNMQKIVNDLHKDVMFSYNRGEKVVLLGHSAGSFVTYRYLFHKLRVISPESMAAGLEKDENGKIDPFYRKHPVKSTCLDAITRDKLGVYSMTDGLVRNENEQKLKANYLNLDKYTDSVCVPDDGVIGVVNYGSPVALFYSDISVRTPDSSNYNLDILKFLQKNNMFLITVNFANDPIGFPLTRNVSAEEYENIYNTKFSPEGKGFVYSKSDFVSPLNVMGAHNSYWKCPDKFAKAIVKAYSDGYKTFYPDL